MMLFWLKPSRLIRPPIYSLKQARLRKRMVRKYCVLYFAVLILFIVIIVAPAVASGQIAVDQFANIGGSGSIADGLFQPRNVSNNDTGNHRPKPTLGVI